MNTQKRAHRIRALRKDEKGVAAIEFAFIVSILAISILNVVDFADYFFTYMQVNQAAEMGAQAAWVTCTPGNPPATPSSLPATANCSNMTTAVANSVQSTSLGTHVTQQTGSPSESWYCVNSSGALVSVAAVTTTAPYNEPLDCSAVSEPSYSPGDYVEVQVTYTWTPIFPGLSVASALSHTMTSTSYTRLQ